MSIEIPFWDKPVETLDRKEIEELQLIGLKAGRARSEYQFLQ